MMGKSEAIIVTGIIHEIPPDLRELLIVAPEVLRIWNELMPLKSAGTIFAN